MKCTDELTLTNDCHDSSASFILLSTYYFGKLCTSTLIAEFKSTYKVLLFVLGLRRLSQYGKKEVDTHRVTWHSNMPTRSDMNIGYKNFQSSRCPVKKVSFGVEDPQVEKLSGVREIFLGNL